MIKDAQVTEAPLNEQQISEQQMKQAQMKEFVVVGAGMSGLILANRLKSDSKSVVVVEKSRGVGGRMATRRTAKARFDHGAQFYTLLAPIEVSHNRWGLKSLAELWFESERSEHYCCPGGMTALAKELATDLETRFELRLLSLLESESGWILCFEDASTKGGSAIDEASKETALRSESRNVEIHAKQVILTAPLPQSLEILRKSGIEYDRRLDNIHYAKAIVALIEFNEPVLSESALEKSELQIAQTHLAGSQGYREFSSGRIFSIADQKQKGLSSTAALTVTLNPKASEDLFDAPDDEITRVVVKELLELQERQERRLLADDSQADDRISRMLDSALSSSSIQIKKWRYSHPLQTFAQSYGTPRANLYLAGDAFGGPSLNGAARSANALGDFLASQSIVASR